MCQPNHPAVCSGKLFTEGTGWWWWRYCNSSQKREPGADSPELGKTFPKNKVKELWMPEKVPAPVQGPISAPPTIWAACWMPLPHQGRPLRLRSHSPKAFFSCPKTFHSTHTPWSQARSHLQPTSPTYGFRKHESLLTLTQQKLEGQELVPLSSPALSGLPGLAPVIGSAGKGQQVLEPSLWELLTLHFWLDVPSPAKGLSAAQAGP